MMRLLNLFSFSFVLFLLTCLIPAKSSLLFAQQATWIPADLGKTTLLVERYHFQDPAFTLEHIDSEYETLRNDYLTDLNAHLDKHNEDLQRTFKAYKGQFATTSLSKIDEQFADIDAYRYVLKRELYFGEKRVKENNSLKDASYFAYRYYFYDRKTKKEYDPYYFSGPADQQVKRIVYWLNRSLAAQ